MPPWILYQEKAIVDKSKDVSINQFGIEQLAHEIICILKQHYTDKNDKIGKKYLRHSNDFPSYNDYRSADWLFVLNTLNFSLWIPKSAKQWTVNGYTGYSALCSAIKRAIEKDKKPLWDPRYYMNMTISQMKKIFLGDDEISIPFIEERLKILQDVGKILVMKYNGTFLCCIKLCKNNAIFLMNLLINEFQCYQDKVLYCEKEVCLNTKAKILIKDLEIYYPIKSMKGMFADEPTMFADYRCLQLFIDYKVLCYSEKLRERFKTNDHPVCYGSTEELEIRGCSIIAFKRLCAEVQKLLVSFTDLLPIKDFIKSFSIQTLVDNILFLFIEYYCFGKSLDILPFHNIMTKHY